MRCSSSGTDSIRPPTERQSGAIAVLHVDDEPDFADMVAGFLEREADPIAVTTATTPEAGLEHVETGAFDCVISDYEMPGMTGLEFLEAVRGIDPDVPFILYTGRGSEEIASEAISAGVTDYLQKAADPEHYELLANRVINVVQQYRAQAAADRAERRLLEIANHSTDVQWMVSGGWEEVLFVNDAYERIWGRPIAALEADLCDCMNGIHPEDRDRVEAAMDRLSAGEAVDLEVRVNAREDYRRWVWIEGQPITDDDGAVDRIVGFARDVSDRRDRERRLERERDRFSMLFETVPEPAVHVVFEEGEPVVRHVNDAFEAVFGHSEAAARGRSLDDLIVPDRLAAEADAINRSAMDGQPITREVRRLTADGERTFRFTAAAMSDGDGFGEGVATYVDVTERTERERELERYETILEATGDAVYTLDADGRFTYVNDALLGLVGYDREDLLGEHVGIVMSEDDIATGQRLIASLLDADESRGLFEMELVTVDDDRIPCENHVALLPADGGFRGTVGVLRDVTNRKERERRLERQNERLERFASIVSHDLRNPLNVAEGRLELAMRECDSEHLEPVAAAHDRMGRLIEDLLTMARSPDPSVDPTPVVLGDVTEACWGTVDTADATLSLETDRTVLADECRLRQLLENLIRNAVQHGGATVTVTVGDLEDGFFVADDGPGIPPEDRDRVLDPTYTTASEGTGLGLAIVEEIAEAHGWTLAVTEGETGGARFEFHGVSRPDGA